MEDLERYGDDNAIDDEEVEGKKSAFGIFFKILVAFTCILVVGVLGCRIYLSEYTPKEMRYLAFCPSVENYYEETDGNIGAKTQKLRFSYDNEKTGTFFGECLIVIPEIDHLQVTVRYNTSTLTVLEETYGETGLIDTDMNEKLSFRLLDNYERVYDNLVYEEVGEMAMYRYFKLAFDGVDFDPQTDAPEWIRLEIFYGDEAEPFSYILIYENNEDYSTFSDYKLSKEEVPG